MDRYELSQQRAAQVVKSEERRRANLYRKIGKQDYDQPNLYHLVINMAKVDLNEAANIIIELTTPKN